MAAVPEQPCRAVTVRPGTLREVTGEEPGGAGGAEAEELCRQQPPARSPQGSRCEPGQKAALLEVGKPLFSHVEFAGGRCFPPGPPRRSPAHSGASARGATPRYPAAPSLRRGGEAAPRAPTPPGHPPELLTCRWPSYRPPSAPAMAPGQRRPAASRTEGGRSRARAAAATMKSRATCAGAGGEGGGARGDTSDRSSCWGTSTRGARGRDRRARVAAGVTNGKHPPAPPPCRGA